MPNAIPFQGLADQIQQRETELARLRKELEAHQTHLAKLTRRKQELLADLEKIDREIAAVVPSSPPGDAAVPSKTPSPMPAEKVSLPKFLIGLVEQAGRPITTKELTDEVVRSKFPTTSKNLEGMVKTRVYDLVRKGLLKRAGDSGIVAPKASMKTSDTKVPAAEPKNGKKPTAAAKPAASPAAPKWSSLHEVLTHVLARSTRPLSAQELAERVVKNGYESKSKDLKNVIWVSIGKIDGVERVKGEGYRLKKGK
jgi:hypothetical protein